MGIKSKTGQSSVKAPKMRLNDSIKIVSGKEIVMKPINKHHSNPGYGKK